MSLRITYSKSYSLKQDAELWSDLKAGDRQAFSNIYYKYSKVLLDYSLKITSDKKLIEDCLQEMFLELWNGRTGLSEVQMVRNYLFTMLRRKIIKTLKSQKSIFSLEKYYDLNFELPLEGTMILEQDDLEKKEKLYNNINKLSSLQKEIIYLKYYNNFSFEEIADILKLNKKCVYNNLSKAMIRLRKAFVPASIILFFL